MRLCRNVSEFSTKCFHVAHVSQSRSHWCTGAEPGLRCRASRCRLGSTISSATPSGTQCLRESYLSKGLSSTAMKRAPSSSAFLARFHCRFNRRILRFKTIREPAHQNRSRATMNGALYIGSAGALIDLFFLCFFAFIPPRTTLKLLVASPGPLSLFFGVWC